MKVFFVQRLIQFQTGEAILLPFGIFESEEAAKAAGARASSEFSALARTAELGRRYQDPSGKVGLEPIGLPVGELLTALGIKGVGHNWTPHDVHSGSGLLLPDKKLIVPTSH